MEKIFAIFKLLMIFAFAWIFIGMGKEFKNNIPMEITNYLIIFWLILGKWFEDFYDGRYAKVSVVSGTTGDITLTVVGAGSSSAYIFTVGDVVRNFRTGENFLVATVASATTITAVTAGRSFGSTAAATMLAQDALYIIGNASEENASARNINTTRSTEETNYTLDKIWV